MTVKMRSILFGLPLAVFVALTVVFFLAIGNDSSLLPSARLGKPLPAFSLTLLEDEARQVTEADLRGHPALLNVWATWCPTCRVEHAALNALAAQNIIIYGLNYKDERDMALQYLDDLGNPYRFTIFDEAGDLGLDLGVYGAPETYILDADGFIQYRHVGEVTLKVWKAVLEPKLSALILKTPAVGEATDSEVIH